MNKKRKFKLPKEVMDFIKSNGTAVTIGDDYIYYNLPQWFMVPESGGEICEIVFPDYMTEQLKSELGIDQELSLLTEKYNALEEELIETHRKSAEEQRKYNKLKEAFEELLEIKHKLGKDALGEKYDMVGNNAWWLNKSGLETV